MLVWSKQENCFKIFTIENWKKLDSCLSAFLLIWHFLASGGGQSCQKMQPLYTYVEQVALKLRTPECMQSAPRRCQAVAQYGPIMNQWKVITYWLFCKKVKLRKVKKYRLFFPSLAATAFMLQIKFMYRARPFMPLAAAGGGQPFASAQISYSRRATLVIPGRFLASRQPG